MSQLSCYSFVSYSAEERHSVKPAEQSLASSRDFDDFVASLRQVRVASRQSLVISSLLVHRNYQTVQVSKQFETLGFLQCICANL